MSVFRVAVTGISKAASEALLADQLRDAGLTGVTEVRQSRLFFLEGELVHDQASRIAADLLIDPVTERFVMHGQDDQDADDPARLTLEVHRRPGVMDPVAASTLAELRAEGLPVDAVRCARRYEIEGTVEAEAAHDVAGRVLANDCIERIVVGSAGVHPSPEPPASENDVRTVALRALNDAALERLSRDGHLFLSLAEMQTIQAHFRELGREPTDLELETLAQTWSEHCVHKTLKSSVVYRGAALPPAAGRAAGTGEVELRYANLLKDTIARATDELIAEQRGPECLSVFEDNAGVIGFDEDCGIAFKVETHNHPSAIEPYGGAATGIGGCIRDVMGCGLGARPIANTDVFCVAPGDWPEDRLPSGVLHPRRVLRGIVQGVADYGNRMGIPTVNGAVHFDPRYLGNPLVYCGCVGVIPRDKIGKAARPGDRVVVIGGRTGRDGIHGATFSSAELTDTHADEFAHAVQIGNAITEKRCLDAMMRARDHADGCLYTATTDCGAGGLSSAVGEMGESVGVEVCLDDVPLKYSGLRYDEIWISEAQERMVLAVPPENLDRILRIMEEEEVEATVIGTFGNTGDGGDEPRLVVRCDGAVVGDLRMHFLHEGLPAQTREAAWQPTTSVMEVDESAANTSPEQLLERVRQTLGAANTVGRHWIIRGYDHEVQGGSAVKPLCGPGRGPADAAVLRPRLDSRRALAVGCGMAPGLSDHDPYWMAVASIDEAVRNVVCVGGDPERIAILDNFCWGRTDDPRQLGGLVRACQACYDVAKAYGVPFVSGKDSLNNEFALQADDVPALMETLETMVARAPGAAGIDPIAWPAIADHVRRTQRLRIPDTLLISAISLIDDVHDCVTPDLKTPGATIFLVGGLPRIGLDLNAARDVHLAVARACGAGLVSACHDLSEEGWLPALAEMALAGDRGVDLDAEALAIGGAFSPRCAGYLVETTKTDELRALLTRRNVAAGVVGASRDDKRFSLGDASLSVAELRSAWSGQ